ncbi:uncharacterized protein UTRI_00638_B [Ustilago trichophora]|uniref:Uncharacterized protein n=1 Tax=Ustilago trichophora TaxID=86804 RepID=A0A5C3DPM8_9BASI|nr:uncharacterized protein UTRI_00638_B [Ustilago trichophora]
MSRSSGAVIDLTEESPPAHARPRPPTVRTDTHIADWSSSSRQGESSSSRGRIVPTASSSSSSSRRAVEPIVVGSDDEDDDTSFTITGQSEPVRRLQPLQRSFSAGTTASAGRHTTAQPSLRFHDGIGRGPHGHTSLIPQGPGIIDQSSSGRYHPLLPPRRAAIPSSSTTAARRSGGSTTTGSDASFMSRIGGEFSFGGFGFGPSYSMELLGNLIRGIQSRGAGPQPSTERKVPQEYDPKWTHPYEVQPGFTHSIIEPPVDLDTYFDDKAVVTGPLPDTTPICPCCRHALVTGANGDQRIWVLPCGHVIDGRCIDRLSGLTELNNAKCSLAKGKGKAKAVDLPEDEPPAKAPRTSMRTRATQLVADPSPTESPPKKPKKPKRFECPVQGCDQRCTKEANSKFSAWEVFV